MALVKGTNSYVTVAEADSYFADRLDATAWTAATADQKSQALITATAMLDNLDWIGVAVSDLQPLAFPRIGIYFDPRVGADVMFEDTVVPIRIEIAAFELALHLLNNSGLLDDTGRVDSIVVGSIELKDIKPAQKLPPFVLQQIKPLRVRPSVTNSWWRAN